MIGVDSNPSDERSRNACLGSLERHGKERSAQGLLRIGEPLLILVESSRKSLNLALAPLRPAQISDQKPLVILGSKDRIIIGETGPSSARDPVLLPPVGTEKKKRGEFGKAPEKCIAMPFVAQISILVSSSLYE